MEGTQWGHPQSSASGDPGTRYWRPHEEEGCSAELSQLAKSSKIGIHPDLARGFGA